MNIRQARFPDRRESRVSGCLLFCFALALRVHRQQECTVVKSTVVSGGIGGMRFFAFF